MKREYTADEARDLWETMRKRILEAEEKYPIEFVEDVFPEDPNGKYFYDIKFKSDVDFTKAIFPLGHIFDEKTIFRKDAIFDEASFEEDTAIDCVFEGKASFRGAFFKRVVSFHSKFKDDVSFENAKFSDDALFGTHFSGLEFDSSVSFDDAVFGNSVNFKGLDFNGKVSFNNATFKYWSEFVNLKFNGLVSFEGAHFLKETGQRDQRRNLVRFQNIEFGKKVSFQNCQFDCIARFVKNEFKDQVDFQKATFNNNVLIERTNIFHDRLFLNESYKSFSRPEDAVEPYRIAKQTAHRDADSRWEGIYHYQEQCARNKANRKNPCLNFRKGDFWRGQKSPISNYFEFVIGRLVFGYGEKWSRPLITGLIVILVYASIFFAYGGINYGSLPDKKKGSQQLAFEAVEVPYQMQYVDDDLQKVLGNSGNCLYFSVVTFTTLGYGDFQPYPGIPRFLSASEAVLGAALMAMFIVSLSRKFVR